MSHYDHNLLDSFLTELCRAKGNINRWLCADNIIYNNLRLLWGHVLKERAGLNYEQINSLFTSEGQIGDIWDAACSWMRFCNEG